MTKEEAGQIILEGKPWVKCRMCDGRGHVPDDETDVDCHICFTKGYLLKLGVREAYQVAGLELPVKPASAIEQEADRLERIRKVIASLDVDIDITPPSYNPEQTVKLGIRGETTIEGGVANHVTAQFRLKE